MLQKEAEFAFFKTAYTELILDFLKQITDL